MTLPRWPIVGRRPELEVFERALGSGERAGLVIYGRAGVGKTRLADECADQATASGHPTQRLAGSRTTALLPLGVRATDYQTVGDSLIAAIAAVLGEEFDAAMREAWVLAFNIVAETMLEGAAAARPIGS